MGSFGAAAVGVPGGRTPSTSRKADNARSILVFCRSRRVIMSSNSLAIAPDPCTAVSNNGVRGGCHGIDSIYSPTETPSAPPPARCAIIDGRLGHIINILLTSLGTCGRWHDQG